MEFLTLTFLCVITAGVPLAVIFGVTERWLCKKGRKSSFLAWGLFLPALTILLSVYCVGACYELWPFFGIHRADGWGGMLWPLDIWIYCLPIWIGTLGCLIGAALGKAKKE